MIGTGGMGGFMAGSVVGKLLLDKTGWNSSIKDIAKDQEKLGASANLLGVQFITMGKRLSGLGKSLSLAFTLPLIAIGGAATKMAMDAVESENLFEVSMGGMAQAAREWSKELSKSLGVNQYESRKVIGTFNVMLVSMGQGKQAAYDMAKGLTQLAYDMASFYNLKPEEAFQKLQAGISGETEPLKRLGILISEETINHWALTHGIIRQGEALTQNQKITARYNSILEQTKMAQGDLARTIDSPTNQLRLLKSRAQETAVTFGMLLLPVMSKLTEFARSATEALSNLSDAQKKTTVHVLTWVAIIGPSLYVIGKLTTGIGLLIKDLVALRLILTGLAKLGAISIVIWVSIMGIAQYKKQIEEINNMADELAKRTGEKQLTGLREVWFTLQNIFGGATTAQAAYAEALKKTGAAIEAVLPPGKQLTDAAWNWVLGINGAGEAVEKFSKRLEYLKLEFIDVHEVGDKAISELMDAWSRELGGVVEIPIELDLEGLGVQGDEAIGIMDEFIIAGAERSEAAGKEAKKALEEQQALLEQAEAGTINGFISIMDGSKAMGEFFSSIVKIMIADIGRLVIAEMMAAKKGVIGQMMVSVAHFIASIFKKVPFPLNIVLAVGAFALVSKLFSKLLKFKEGGVFTKPTIAEVGHGTEYVLPKKKLIDIVRGAMVMPRFNAAPAMAMAGVGGGVAVTVNFNAPIVSATGYSRRDMDAAGEYMVQVIDKQLVRVGAKPLIPR
jgi:hypothetical protein